MTVFAGIMLLNSCHHSRKDLTKGELIFRSGFEPDSRMTGYDSMKVDITGIDHSVDPPNNWEAFDENPRIGFFHIEFQGGDSSMRKAQIIEDPARAGNHVLQYWAKYPNVGYNKSYGGKTRIQTDCYYNDSLFDIFYKFRMYLTKDWNILKDREEGMDWFIIAEYWNNAGWLDEGHRFRMHLLITREEGVNQPLNFEVGAQVLDEDREYIWKEKNDEFDIPIGEWLDMEIYLKEGDLENGRFKLSVTRKSGNRTTLFDITNYTHHPDDQEPDGFRHVNLLKCYSHRDNINYVREHGGVVQILWDDLELWTGIRY